MPVHVIIGEIFDSKAQTLVNTVNCVGVMGKGIALGFKEHFPDMFEDYVRRCEAKEVKLGRPYLFKRLLPPWILNFPTKEHWRSVSSLKAIVSGLEYLARHYREWGIMSLAVPPLGCGHGQLEWRVVGPTLYRHLKRLEIPVELYAPFGTPHEELQPAFLDQPQASDWASSPLPPASRIQPGWVALVEILRRIEQERYHTPVGRIAFQKMAYFATEAGVRTGLEFRKGSFGPYAPALKRITAQLVNNGLIIEELIDPMIAVKVGPTLHDALKVYGPRLREWKKALEQVVDLFLRIRRTSQAEIAATVHFAAKLLKQQKGERPTEREVLTETKNWKLRRKPSISEEEVAVTIRNLAMLGWLDVRSSEDLPVPDELAAGA